MTAPRRLLLVSAVAAVLAGVLVACGSGGSSGYVVTAHFPQAVALFEDSRVKLMGIDVGVVETIAIEDDTVRVDMRIRDDVPLPTHVMAAITPLTLIGERNIVLTPPFSPGDDRAPDGHRIDPEDVRVPVEPDDVLAAITDLVQAVDPDRLAGFLSDSAATLDGQGERFNAALGDGARLMRFLAEQDDRLLDTAETLQSLVASLNTREEQFTRLVDVYARASRILADERDRFARLFNALLRLTDEGAQVVVIVEDRVPEGLADLLRVQLRIEANVDSINQLVASLPDIADMVIGSHRADESAIHLTVDAGPSANGLIEEMLGIPNLFNLPALSDLLESLIGDGGGDG